MQKDGLKIESVKNSDTGQLGAFGDIGLKIRNDGYLRELQEDGVVRVGGFIAAINKWPHYGDHVLVP